MSAIQSTAQAKLGSLNTPNSMVKDMTPFDAKTARMVDFGQTAEELEMLELLPTLEVLAVAHGDHPLRLLDNPTNETSVPTAVEQDAQEQPERADLETTPEEVTEMPVTKKDAQTVFETAFFVQTSGFLIPQSMPSSQHVPTEDFEIGDLVLAKVQTEISTNSVAQSSGKMDGSETAKQPLLMQAEGATVTLPSRKGTAQSSQPHLPIVMSEQTIKPIEMQPLQKSEASAQINILTQQPNNDHHSPQKIAASLIDKELTALKPVKATSDLPTGTASNPISSIPESSHSALQKPATIAGPIVPEHASLQLSAPPDAHKSLVERLVIQPTNDASIPLQSGQNTAKMVNQIPNLAIQNIATFANAQIKQSDFVIKTDPSLHVDGVSHQNLDTSQTRMTVTQQPTTVAAQHIARQLAEAFPQLSSRQMTISLSPDEFGKVQLSLTANDKGMVVNILADRVETLDLLRRHITDLSQEFQSLGYDSIDFSFGHTNPQDHPEQQNLDDLAESNLATQEPEMLSTETISHLSLGKNTNLDLRL